MWIFTVTEIMFFVTGFLSALSVWGLWQLKTTFRFSWPGLVGGGLTAFTALFTVLWCFSAVAEGEVRAAAMGLLVFGGTCLVLVGVTRQLVLRTAKGPKPGDA